MAAPKIKVTYSLDPATVEELERLARIWKTSKSGALRRAVDLAGASQSKLAQRRSGAHRQSGISEQLGALRELQDGMALSEADANVWVQQVREARRSWPDRRLR